MCGRERSGGAREERDALDWVCEAWRHCKPIAASGEGVELLRRCPGVLERGSPSRAGNGGESAPDGLVTAESVSPNFAAAFVRAMTLHRFWDRSGKNRLGTPGDRETRGQGEPPARRSGAEARSAEL